MIDIFEKYDYILGSGSPRRAQLLTEAGLKFKIIKSNVDETFDSKMDIYEVAEYLSVVKSDALANNLSSNQLLITADSVVIFNNTILGKPNSVEEAKDTIKRLSGKTHEVITGVCLRTVDRTHSFSVKTEVVFDAISDCEIDHYVSKYKPFDKAGSYGVQEWIGHCKVAYMSGTYTNVMGLPVRELYQALNNHF